MIQLVDCGRYVVGIAHTASDRAEVFRLRYRVFVEEWNNPGLANTEGIEHDRVDLHCTHLMLRESVSGACVGTYRTLTREQADQIGGFFSEGLFDLGELCPCFGDVLETGRACIAKEHRNGLAIAALWQGLARLTGLLGKRWLFGCSSFATTAPDILGPAVRELRRRGHLNDQFRVRPHASRAFSLPMDGPDGPVQLPPLIKGYCRVGAHFADQPAWDPAVGSVDFLTVVEMDRMPDRYRAWYIGGVESACSINC